MRQKEKQTAAAVRERGGDAGEESHGVGLPEGVRGGGAAETEGNG